jgi:hypothetical protein
MIQAGGRLLQQFIVDLFSQVEGDRLNYVRDNQETIRADTYRGIVDAVDRGDGVNDVGRGVILAPTFIGGPRYHNANYQDSMAVVGECVCAPWLTNF